MVKNKWFALLICTVLAFLEPAAVVAHASSADISSTSSAEGSSQSQSVSEGEAPSTEGETSSSDSSSSSSSTPESAAPQEDASTPSADAAFSSYPTPPFADDIQSQAVYMVNLDSGAPVYLKNEQQRIAPSYLVQIMTAIIALENVEDLDNETTTLSPEINNYLAQNHVTLLGGIYTGESLCIRDLLYAMMLQSATDAAMMIAQYVGGGDLEHFYVMMNEKAREIGAKNTQFVNATGFYNENSYSTAYDLALITQYAWENEKIRDDFRELVTANVHTSLPTARHPEGITWYSINYLQQSSQEDYYPYASGIKVGGHTDQNIRNHVSTATRDGYTYLLVTAGAPIRTADTGELYQRNLAFVDARNLYNWAFETFEVKTLMQVGQTITSLGVGMAWDVDHVNLVAADKFASLVTKETTQDSITPEPVFYNAKTRAKGNRGETEFYIDAPIQKGQEVGYVKLILGGEEVGRVRLVAAESIQQSKWLYYVEMIKGFFATFVFKFIITLLVILIVLYAALLIIRNYNRQRYRSKRRRPPRKRSQ